MTHCIVWYCVCVRAILCGVCFLLMLLYWFGLDVCPCSPVYLASAFVCVHGRRLLKSYGEWCMFCLFSA